MSELLTGLLQESISGIALGCIYALIALGFTLIYKATEVVNFNPSTPLNSPWEVGYIPKGMVIVKRGLRRLSGLGEVVEYIMLSDGLVDVSVYLQDRENNNSLDNLIGTIQSDTLLSIEHGKLNVTIIGKLPASTSNEIAKSIQRVN